MLLKLACWIAKKHGFILIKSKVPNYKTQKKIYQIWVRARRLGLMTAPFSSFRMSVVSKMSWGNTPIEMKMNIGQLEKHLKKIAKNRSQEG